MRKNVKCVVWDLDNTIWDGILLEDENVELRKEVIDIVKELDNRGILQSIASKNEYSIAIEKMKEYHIDEYFLYPQINWDSKSSSIDKITRLLNIGKDTIAFVDDQIFEREEVKFSNPEVSCIDVLELDTILDRPEMTPQFITEDSKKRRHMYLSEIKRKKIKEDFKGSEEDFLASLEMNFSISDVNEEDLKRAEELTVRTNQLNTTGYTYSYEELDAFRKSDNHMLLIAELKDKFGEYGKIGITLVECKDDIWTIKLLLMSCRVMSRGVGSILLNHIMNLAKKKNVKLQADFVKTDRNRAMYVTYKFAGFKEVYQNGNFLLLENNLEHIQSFPHYVNISTKFSV